MYDYCNQHDLRLEIDARPSSEYFAARCGDGNRKLEGRVFTRSGSLELDLCSDTFKKYIRQEGLDL